MKLIYLAHILVARRIPAALLLCLSCMACFSQNTILWEVKDTVHHKTSYLLGTYHQLGNHFADGHPVIAEKLLASELAVFESLSEVDFTAAILARPANPEYRKALGKKYANHLGNMAAGWKYPPDKLRPEEILVKLYQSYFENHCGNLAATDTFDHFDRYLIHLSRKNGVPVFGLETDSMQMEYISESIGEGGWERLKGNISFWIDAHLGKKDEDRLCDFTWKYKKFELDYALGQPCGDDKLVVARNENWMKILPEKLRTHRCFVAVGLSHLYNDCGLIEQLKRQGFQVCMVPMGGQG